jgi:hypothetical protein
LRVSHITVLGACVMVSEGLPTPLECVGVLSDVGAGDGLVVLAGDPLGRAVLRNSVGVGGFAGRPVFGPDVVDTGGQEVAAQVRRADRFPAPAVGSLRALVRFLAVGIVGWCSGVLSAGGLLLEAVDEVSQGVAGDGGRPPR